MQPETTRTGWNEVELQELRELINHHRSIGEIAFLTQRTQAALEEKVREMGWQLPREFDTQFFFRRGPTPPTAE